MFDGRGGDIPRGVGGLLGGNCPGGNLRGGGGVSCSQYMCVRGPMV